MQNWEIGVSGMPAPTGHLVLGYLETPLKGATARFAPVHLQQLGLERGSRERNCRFEVSKLFIFIIILFWFLMVC